MRRKGASFGMTVLAGFIILVLAILLIFTFMGKLHLSRIFRNVLPDLLPPEDEYVESYTMTDAHGNLLSSNVTGHISSYDSCAVHNCRAVAYTDNSPTGFFIDFSKDPITIEISYAWISGGDVTIGEINTIGGKQIFLFHQNFVDSCSSRYSKRIDCQRALAFDGSEFAGNQFKIVQIHPKEESE